MIGAMKARSLGWAAVLAICLALVTILSFRVHAVRSEVLLAERELIALKRETLLLETEFEARASQRQLAEWNAVEFGYAAPRAGQFLDGTVELAALGQRPGPDAPAPIRLARADQVADAAVPPQGEADAPMRSPLSGAPVTLASADSSGDAGAVFAEAFGKFLIEASPIRPARAQNAKAASVKGVVE
jgi:hypothetical protein